MTLPTPVPGLVIRYAYLWRDEARQGAEEPSKERPAVVVLAVHQQDGRTVVTVAPITRSPPARPEFAIEVPPDTKRRLGLDDARSWIVTTDLNQFVWPGPDLRPLPGSPSAYAYGLLPAGLYRQVRDRVVALARAGRAAMVRRTE